MQNGNWYSALALGWGVLDPSYISDELKDANRWKETEDKASVASFATDCWIQAINLIYFALNLQASLVLLKNREQRTGPFSKRSTGSYWTAFSPQLCNTMSLALTHLAIFFLLADAQFGTELTLFFTCDLNQAWVTAFPSCNAVIYFFSSSEPVYTNRKYFAALLL